MKIKDFVDFYNEEIEKSSEKFKKIIEILDKCVYFNGINLQKLKYHKFSDLKYLGEKDTIFFASFGNSIEICWYSSDGEDTYFVDFDYSFFDDFETFLKNLNEEILKNNEIEEDKYNKYLIKKTQEEKESPEYREYLRLKEKFENV